MSGRLSDRRLWVLIPVALCAYTHMWNPAGFPDLYDDESAYISRSLGALDGDVLHGYDHPFFGQVAIAGFMAAAGYPDVGEGADPEQLEKFYAVPRTFMGLLAVAGAFLVYRIADERYGPRAALLASVMFAVMPVSLVLRHVLLDSVMLPLVLLSVFLAMRAGRCPPSRRAPLLAAAGACMGLALLTKVPSLAALPLAAGLAYAARRQVSHAVLYVAPAALTASAWPAAAALAGQLPAWLDAVLWQAGRANAGLPSALAVLFMTDPVMTALGACGLAYALATRDRFLLLWMLPVLVFFGLLGYVVYYHLVLLLPAACVAAAAMIDKLAGRAAPRLGGRASMAAVAALAAFGLSVSGTVIHADATEAQLAAMSWVLQNHDGASPLVSNQTYGWLPSHLRGAEFVPYGELPDEPQEGTVLVAGSWIMENGGRLAEFRDGSRALASFEGPGLGGPWQRWYAGELYADLRRALDPQTGQSPFFEHGRWAARGASVEVLQYGG